MTFVVLPKLPGNSSLACFAEERAAQRSLAIRREDVLNRVSRGRAEIPVRALTLATLLNAALDEGSHGKVEDGGGASKDSEPRVALLKVDVEGAELEVLRGLSRSDWRRVDRLVAEVHDCSGRREALDELLRDQGGFQEGEVSWRRPRWHGASGDGAGGGGENGEREPPPLDNWMVFAERALGHER